MFHRVELNRAFATGPGDADGRKQLLAITLHRYRCLQLSVNGFNTVFGSLNAALHAEMIVAIVFFVYGMARSDGATRIFMAYLVLESITWYPKVISMFAEIHSGSRAHIELAKRAGWSSGIQTKNTVGSLAKRELRTMKELRITAGGMFYFDKPLVLNFIDIVLGQTVNLLIMY